MTSGVTPVPSSTCPLRKYISRFGILEAIRVRKANEFEQRRTGGFGSEHARTPEILQTRAKISEVDAEPASTRTARGPSKYRPAD
jgi:hypothetical protein